MRLTDPALFEDLNGATVNGLNISSSIITSADDKPVGSIASLTTGDVMITNSSANMKIKKVATTADIGGLVGSQQGGNLTIANSYYSGNINLTTVNQGITGGLIGTAAGTATTINNSFTITDFMTNSTTNNNVVGGLIGKTAATNTIIGNTYFSGYAINSSATNSLYGGVIGIAENNAITVDNTLIFTGEITNFESFGIIAEKLAGVITTNDVQYYVNNATSPGLDITGATEFPRGPIAKTAQDNIFTTENFFITKNNAVPVLQNSQKIGQIPNQIATTYGYFTTIVEDTMQDKNIKINEQTYLSVLKNDGVNNNLILYLDDGLGSHLPDAVINYTYDDYIPNNGDDSNGSSEQSVILPGTNSNFKLDKAGKYVIKGSEFGYIDGTNIATSMITIYVVESFESSFSPYGNTDEASFGLSSPEQLVMIDAIINNTPGRRSNLNFHLMNDLDFTNGYDYDGNLTPANMLSIEGIYSGHFDGAGHSIIGMKTITGGLFNTLGTNAVINDLNLVNSEINNLSTRPTGGLANNIDGTATISNSSVSNIELTDTAGVGVTGALVGQVSGGSTSVLITNTYTTGNIISASDSLIAVAGLVGFNGSSALAINNSYSLVNFESSIASGNGYSGGLVGMSSNSNLQINNSYYRGSQVITANDLSSVINIGGLVGLSTSTGANLKIENSFA